MQMRNMTPNHTGSTFICCTIGMKIGSVIIIMLTCSTNTPRKMRNSIMPAITASGGRPTPVIIAARPLLDVAAATTRADAATLVTSYGMADCMGSTQGAQVRALLATDPGTPAEAGFFNATLAPLLRRCAATAGGSGQISVDARTLRGILAEALYRWSAVQRDGPSSPWARR